MSDELDFDFTDAELFAAFRLVTSEAEARRQTEEVRSAWTTGMDWAASTELLLLLSVGSDTGREKVERIRKAGQEARLATAVRRETGTSGTAPSDGELMERVQAAVVEEDRRWEEQRSEMRRALRGEGEDL